MSTGSNSRRLVAAAAAAALLGLPPHLAQAQTLKLRGLSIPQGIQPGAWVSYQINVWPKNRSAREFLQRLAIVSGEGAGEEAGVWVELKTVEAGKTRIERGFFGQGSEAGREAEDEASNRGEGAPPKKGDLRLLRYQLLTPDGTLREYPLGLRGAPRLDEDISAIGLVEFDPDRPADRDSLGPDTLRIGRKIVPCAVTRVRRYGSDEWFDDDSTFVNRVVMARTYWRNPAIPVTGYAKAVIEVATERARVAPAAAAPDSAAAVSPDSAAGSPGPALPSSNGAETRRSLYRAEVTLLDLGTGAVPEVTQEPEPAPAAQTPEEDESHAPGKLIK